MIERTYEAESVNRFVAHPEVPPWLSAVVSDRRNVVLTGEHGYCVFAYRVDGVYEWHAGVTPAGQGSWALSAARAAIDYLFAQTNAVAVLAAIPESNEPARVVVGHLGFVRKQTVPSALLPAFRGLNPTGTPDNILVYVLYRPDWVMEH